MNIPDSDKHNKSSPFSDSQTAVPKDIAPEAKHNSLDKHQQAQHAIEQNRQVDSADKAVD